MKYLKVITIAVLVNLGFAFHSNALQPEPLLGAAITNPQVDIVQFKMDIAAFRTECEIESDALGASHGYIRPANIADDPVFTRDICEQVTGNECIIWLCFATH